MLSQEADVHNRPPNHGDEMGATDEPWPNDNSVQRGGNSGPIQYNYTENPPNNANDCVNATPRLSTTKMQLLNAARSKDDFGNKPPSEVNLIVELSQFKTKEVELKARLKRSDNTIKKLEADLMRLKSTNLKETLRSDRALREKDRELKNRKKESKRIEAGRRLDQRGFTAELEMVKRNAKEAKDAAAVLRQSLEEVKKKSTDSGINQAISESETVKDVELFNLRAEVKALKFLLDSRDKPLPSFMFVHRNIVSRAKSLKVFDVGGNQARVAKRSSRKATFGSPLANVRRERGDYPHRERIRQSIPKIQNATNKLFDGVWIERKRDYCGDQRTNRGDAAEESSDFAGDDDWRDRNLDGGTDGDVDEDMEEDREASGELRWTKPARDDTNAYEQFCQLVGVPRNPIPCRMGGALMYRDETRVCQFHPR
jgi:hypothetical protein